jgi:hypothetical protein
MLLSLVNLNFCFILFICITKKCSDRLQHRFTSLLISSHSEIYAYFSWYELVFVSFLYWHNKLTGCIIFCKKWNSFVSINLIKNALLFMKARWILIFNSVCFLKIHSTMILLHSLMMVT